MFRGGLYGYSLIWCWAVVSMLGCCFVFGWLTPVNSVGHCIYCGFVCIVVIICLIYSRFIGLMFVGLVCVDCLTACICCYVLICLLMV